MSRKLSSDSATPDVQYVQSNTVGHFSVVSVFENVFKVPLCIVIHSKHSVSVYLFPCGVCIATKSADVAVI